MFRSLAAALALTSGLAAAAAPAHAGSDEAFFQSVAGRWVGPGEIVAGKYKGTKFVCDFNGAQSARSVGMSLDGSCRVGLFSQPMRAEVVREGGSYKGAFLDGAAGKGLDIISGNVSDDRMVVGLDRKQLKGAMLARLADADTMAITISVRVEETLVPIIGMNLKRRDARRTASAD
ncbi:hypothetical protein NPA31_005455 [Aurantimonas sp. MSK8Z-1]|uniref:hypothetical protein n=1 Tax=Mangrovibrevibacter kandeliae TaxID=2968473 RepID=UPI002119944D|nr:hypothetical protein [Aurantimonas sp. MSK8Z-1]MCW4114408.1 hypothetical protein [Aurantimonas sp. MSK8Z-1]